MVGYKPAAWEWWTPFACWPGPCDCTQEASIRWHTPLKEHSVSHPRLCVHWGAPWWGVSLLLGNTVPLFRFACWPEACACTQKGHLCWRRKAVKGHCLRYPSGILAASTSCTARNSHYTLEEQHLYIQGSLEESHGSHESSNSTGGRLIRSPVACGKHVAAQALGTSAAVRADSRAASAWSKAVTAEPPTAPIPSATRVL